MALESVKCPKCGSPMASRKSSFGVFWGCQAYPTCDGTRNAMGRSPQDQAYHEEHGTDAGALPSDQWRARDRRRWE